MSYQKCKISALIQNKFSFEKNFVMGNIYWTHATELHISRRLISYSSFAKYIIKIHLICGFEWKHQNFILKLCHTLSFVTSVSFCGRMMLNSSEQNLMYIRDLKSNFDEGLPFPSNPPNKMCVCNIILKWGVNYWTPWGN